MHVKHFSTKQYHLTELLIVKRKMSRDFQPELNQTHKTSKNH